MNVKLISITASCLEINGKQPTPEEHIIYTARVSSNRPEEERVEDYTKLINYLIAHKHWSPFEQISMGVEINTSRAIAAQIIRHWSLRPQEFSQRYAEAAGLTIEESFEIPQLREKAKTNRQGSGEDIGERLYDNTRTLNDIALRALETSLQVYNALIKSGVAPECARGILPLCTKSKLYVVGSVRNWIHYFDVRDEPHAQLEHQEVARAVKQIFTQQFPVISKALNYGC